MNSKLLEIIPTTTSMIFHGKALKIFYGSSKLWILLTFRAGYLTRTGEDRRAFRVLIHRPDEKRPVGGRLAKVAEFGRRFHEPRVAQKVIEKKSEN